MNKLTRQFFNAVPTSGVTFSALGIAQTIPKQANFEVTYEAVGSVVRSIDAGDGQAVNLYQATLLFTNPANTPLLRDISANCIESAFTAAGDNGYCVFTDKDGDKFVETITRAAGQKVGTGTFGAGTGKFKASPEKAIGSRSSSWRRTRERSILSDGKLAAISFHSTHQSRVAAVLRRVVHV